MTYSKPVEGTKMWYSFYLSKQLQIHYENQSQILTLREKFLNTEFFLVRIFLYSVRMQENTDQKKIRILTLFTQCQ